LLPTDDSDIASVLVRWVAAIPGVAYTSAAVTERRKVPLLAEAIILGSMDKTSA
jgi:hypothetical protein